jgi:uncharacterized protein (TIRG00374 family)
VLTKIWRWARYVVGIAAVAAAADALAGRRDELQGIRAYLGRVRIEWVAAAVLAEAVSLLAFAALQRRLLRSGSVDVGAARLTGITLAGNAIANSLPGGPAWASVYAFRRYRDEGADETLAGWTIIGVGACSAVGLAAMALVGLVVAGAEGSELGLLTAIAVPAVLVFAGALVLTRRALLGRIVARALRWSRRVTGRPRGDEDDVVRGVVARLTAVAPSPSAWAVAIGWGLANWIADCSCLVLAFIAVGVGVPWRGLLLAYGAGQLAANLPVTPGGLGVVEGSLTIALVAYGGGESSTVAAVLLYRMISFWVLLPVGYAAYGALALMRRGNGRRR